MRKILLSVGLSFAMFSVAYSQMALQTKAGATISSGDTITMTGVVGAEISQEFYTYDSAIATNVNVLCVPTSQVISGCTYSICVGSLCYPSKADNVNFLSANFKATAGLDTNASLYTDYYPTVAGTTVIRFDLRMSNLGDSTWFYGKFIATPTGIANVTANNLNISNPYPNPANGMVNFNYHTNYTAQLGIYNSLGQLVKNVSLTSSKGNVSVDVSDMPEGIYICKIQSAGAETTFRRLVVSR